MPIQIEQPIRSMADLRDILPVWKGNSSEKDSDRLNDVARKFIARSPYLLMSSVGADGLHDVTPRGDPAGFVQVLDDKTLIIPDRLGNHRADTFENLRHDPRIGLIFLIPGHTETLRISGTGVIARDEALRIPLAINGRLPELVTVVTVEQAFMHCSKSLVRSKLWQSDSWTHADTAPSLAEWVKATVDTDRTLDQVQAIHDDDRKKRLY